MSADRLAPARAALDDAVRACPGYCDSDNIRLDDGLVMAYVTVRPSRADGPFIEAMEDAGFDFVRHDVINYFGVYTGTGLTFEWPEGEA
jgi:hypothetical protein